jgi:hypothetical protein
MAGAGYRTWTAGEVVTANNVQTYLQDQTVGVYAGTAARSSAILSPSEGQVSYRSDDDIVEVYDGTNWVPVSAPDTSGLVHINTTNFSAVASQSINNVFSATYRNYKIFLNIDGFTSGLGAISMRLRASGTDASTANWSRSYQGYTSSNAQDANGDVANTFGYFGFAINADSASEIMIYNPFLTKRTLIYSNNLRFNSSAPVSAFIDMHSIFNETNSYDGFTFFANGNMTGQIQIFGVKE